MMRGIPEQDNPQGTEAYVEKASIAYISILIDAMKRIFDNLAVLEHKWRYLYPDERKAYWSKIRADWKTLYHTTSALARKGGRPLDKWLAAGEEELIHRYSIKKKKIERK